MVRRNLTNDLTQLLVSLGPSSWPFLQSCSGVGRDGASEWLVGVGGTLHFQRLKKNHRIRLKPLFLGFRLSGLCWLFEIGSHYVAQAGFKLRFSSGLSLLSVGILHYHTWLHPYAHFLLRAFPFFLL